MARKRLSMFAFLAAAVLFASTGCATSAKLAQFEALGQAGGTYEQAMDALLTQASATLVNTNSDKLLATNADFPGSVTADALKTQDDALRANLHEMALLRQQVALLADYLTALANLASTDAATSFGTELSSTASQLDRLSTRLRDSSLLKNAQADEQLAGSVGTLVVREIQLRSLERELQAHKQTVAEVLQLHGKLLAALEAQVAADVSFVHDRQYEKEIIQPLVSGQIGDPATWKSERLTLLEPAPLEVQITHAASAVKDLQAAWAKALSNRLTATDVEAVSDKLGEILIAIKVIHNASQPPLKPCV